MKKNYGFLSICLFIAVTVIDPLHGQQLNEEFVFSAALGEFENGDTLVQNYSKAFIIDYVPARFN